MKSWFTEEDSLSSTTKNIYLYFSLQIWGFQIIYLDIIRQSNMQKNILKPPNAPVFLSLHILSDWNWIL